MFKLFGNALENFLAVKWNNYSTVSLNEFAENSYRLMNINFEILPEKVKFMLPYMIKGNWLVNYSNVEGIRKTLTGMSRRTSFNSGMETATEILVQHYPLFENEFELFFEELRNYVKTIE